MKEVNEEKKTQFRWSKPMSKELLTFLANEVQKGNRPNNSFKSSSYVAAANAISKKFNVKCLPEHIDNHLKTVKNAWAVISKLRDKDSGFGWDDNLKMITASPTVYNTYTEVCYAVHCLCFFPPFYGLSGFSSLWCSIFAAECDSPMITPSSQILTTTMT